MAKPPRFDGLTPQTELTHAAAVILGTLHEQFLSHAPEALRGDDVEAVHDMRVALRRVRTALRTFGACFPRRRIGAYVQTARHVARRLGAVRDADVHLAYLRSALAGASTREQPGVQFAIEALAARRRRALAEFAIEFSQYDRDELGRLVEGK